MLRKRSRAVGSKPPGLMADPQSLLSPTGNKENRHNGSSLFPSPRHFVGFSPKGFSDYDAAMSPTSILETKHFSSIGNPLFSDKLLNMAPLESTATSATVSKPIGLGIVDSLIDDKADNKCSKTKSRMVLFASQLKIQIPGNSLSLPKSVELPVSPIEFGIKNKDSQLALFSPTRKSLPVKVPASTPRVFTGSISVSEMELSEDYTCVISHGPNPRTTHIFDNCIMESSGDEFTPRKENCSVTEFNGYPPNDFLSFCHACKKSIGQGKDTFMFRGEKAFCSTECRYQEMLFDEGSDKFSTTS